MKTAEAFGAWLLEASWQAAVLVVLVLAVQAAFGRRLAARWRYALWLLVVARLCMPATPPSPTSVFNLVSNDWKNPAGNFQFLERPSADGARFGASPEAAMTRSDRGGLPTQRPARAGRVALGVWAAVALALLARMALGSYRLSSRVCRQRPVTRQEVLDILEDAKQELGVHVPVSVVESEHVAGPALLGFVRPRLLLPRRMVEQFGRGELRLVFLHELAHVRRRDIAVNWLVSVLHALHWFNPLVWLAFRRLRAERELATDALVLSEGRGGENVRYGETMVKLLEFTARPALVPGIAGILEDKGELKRRMTMIATHAKDSRGGAALAAACLVVLGLTTLTGAKAEEAAPALQDVLQPMNLDFENGQAGWGGGGEGYELAVDADVKKSGKWAGRIRSLAPGGQGFGSYTGTLKPAPVAGKRVRFSGWLRLDEVAGAAALWMRADQGGQPVAFETLQQQNINGTRDWQEYAIEIDIPPGADNINFGALLAGGGTVWADDLRIDVVGDAKVFNTKPAEDALMAWLALVDEGRFGKSWKEAAAPFRGAVGAEQWEQSLNLVRQPMGRLLSRSVSSAVHQTTMPGAPDGDYVVFQTSASFENKKAAVETCTMVLEKDGRWRAAGYFIR